MIYIIEYNDRYGNGDNRNIEGYIENADDFDKWLAEHNTIRVDEGNEPESIEEFDIIPIGKLI